MSDDWIAEDRNHLLRMEREKTARTIARARSVGYVAASVAVAVVILGAIWAVWSGTQKDADRKSAERVACQQSGGTVFDLTTGTVCLRLDGDR